MRIALPNDSQQGVGGGWTFRRNLTRGLQYLGHIVTDDFNNADIALIAGTTMITKQTAWAIRDSKAKMVVRLDNVPRNSRNKNTGTSRLKGFSEMADAVVWQSEWARDYLKDFIGKDGSIIYNGVDQTIFHNNGASNDFHRERKHVYMYSRFNRDETKNWEVAWYKYQLIQRDDPEALLVLVGKFSPELTEYNFDFFRGEKLEYFGIIDNPEAMARLMRGAGKFLATYFNDCFSNTYIEALSCGMELHEPNMSGGTPEMLGLLQDKGIEYFSLDRMAKDYIKLFESILSP